MPAEQIARGDKRPFPWFGRAVIALFILHMAARVPMRAWNNPITWDAFGYHLYLPLAIIHHDLGMRDPTVVQEMFATYDPSSTFYQAHKAPTGDMVIRYAPGVALLDLPAFLIADLVAEPLGFPADGLSRPYQYGASILYLLYLAIGLWVLLRVLEELFGPRIAFFTLLILLLGTNLLVQFEVSCLLTHGYSFMLFALLLRTTMRWHDAPGTGRSIALGVVLGLIALVRPTDALAVLIPILWPLQGADGSGAKLRRLWRSHRAQVAIAVLAALVAFFPLPLYWKVHAGSWIYDSYQNPAEGLDLLAPHTLNFLFSFRKGWFLYTPMMLLAVAGFVPLFRRHGGIAIALLVFFLVDLWVVSSWTVWYYPGGFGQRAMVQAYPIMAIALAALIAWISTWPRSRRRWAVALIGLFTLLNLHQSIQYRLKVFDPVRVTPAYYAATFFDLRPDPAKEMLLLFKRPTDQVVHADLTGHVRHTQWVLEEGDAVVDAPDGRRAWPLDGEHPYTPAIEASFADAVPDDHAWLRIEADVFCDEDRSQVSTVFVAHFDHGGSYAYQAFELKNEDLVAGQWKRVTFDYLTPEPRSRSDRFKIYAWHMGGARVLVDSVQVTSFARDLP